MTGARPPIRVQVDRLGADLATLRRFAERECPHAHGVALAIAHATLVLAVSLPADEEERFVREDILGDAVEALERVGFIHIGPLVAAALICDGLASEIARGVERAQ